MKNKSALIVIAIITVLLLLLIAISIDEKDTKKKTNNPQDIISNAELESSKVKDNEKKDFIEINTDEYLNYYNNEGATIVLIARPTCHYCQIAEPILQQIAHEKNIDINYLNTDNFSEDDYNRFKESNELFSEGFGTPILLVVGNNQIVDYIDGLTDKNHYEEFLKKNNFIQ